MNLWLKYMQERDMEPTHAIIGVDPGDTTGIFICVVHTGGVLIDLNQVNAEGVSTWLGMLMPVLEDCGIRPERTHFAIEKYQITRRTVKLTRRPAAIEVTGVVRAIATDHGAHTWEFGMATSKKFAGDDLLERVGWVPKKRRRSMRHAVDAARQAWTCLAEVDFPTWERSWECVNEVTFGGDLLPDSLAEMLLKMGGLDEEER